MSQVVNSLFKKKREAVDGKFLQTLVEVKIDRKLPYVDVVVKDAV